MNQNIIIDTDIGDDIDDAMAIAFACLCSRLNVIGITTTFWQPEKRRQLVLSLLKQLGFSNIPCHSGATSGIGGNIWSGNENEKYWGNQFSFYEKRNDLFAPEGNAVDYIIEQADEYKKRLTLVGIGPGSNFALALQKRPEITEKLEGVVLMGGNATNPELAEYNLCRDIKAYEILFASGLPLTLAPIEVTQELFLEDFRYRLLESGKAGEILNELYGYWIHFKRNKPGAILYDLAAVMVLSNPEIFEISEKLLELDSKRGVLFSSPSGTPVNVIARIDHDAFWDCFFKTIGS